MSRIAIVFYSQTGQTKRMAQEIAQRCGGDLIEVVSRCAYDVDMWAAADQAMEELRSGRLPEIEPVDLSGYDTVLVGGPVWGMTVSNPLLTFFRTCDLSGKTVSAFWTFYDHDEKYDRTVREEARGAHVVKGLALPRSLTGSPRRTAKAIDAWLARVGVGPVPTAAR